nr:MAG TPA: hypothetical protein [Caudoviricetes sp.]
MPFRFFFIADEGKHLPPTARIEWASETESRTERNRG